MIKRKKI